jgi:hypothetical protein
MPAATIVHDADSATGVRVQSNPYLSVVVASRNDDHGGDPLKRLQVFVDSFDEQCRRTGLDAEVIIVEWNPPSDRPTLDALVRLPMPAFCSYRFVEVPPELHLRLQHADVLPMFQMIAKNVGILRAQGQFVLATNIDIIFSTELVEQIASRSLDPTTLYRVDRHDVVSDVPLAVSLDARLAYCESNQLRLHTRTGSHPVDRMGRTVCANNDIVDGRSVRLGSGWHVRENGTEGRSFRWAGDKVELLVDDAEIDGSSGYALLEMDAESNPHDEGSWLDVAAFEGQRLLARTRVTGCCKIEVPLDLGRSTSRRIELRVVDRDVNRPVRLPAFERRGNLAYRVQAVRLRSLPAAPTTTCEYPLDAWTNPYTGSEVTLTPTPEGLVVTTDSRQFSYCARYGPLIARKSGRCTFELSATVIEGDFTIGVLSSAGRYWIPSSVKTHRNATCCHITVGVDLVKGQPFWLLASNNHPKGDGVSVFVIHYLEGRVGIARSEALDRAVTGRLWSSRFVERAAVTYAKAMPAMRATRRRAGNLFSLRIRPSKIVESFGTRLAQSLGQSVLERVVRDSPEFRTVSQQLQSCSRQLEEFGQLTDLNRLLQERRPADLHVNACGDFQLMAREQWHLLRGYPELETFSMNIDAMLSFMAAAAGLRECVLEPPIYHIEHEVGSGWSPEGEARLRSRIAERGITWLDAQTIHMWAMYMAWLGRPMIFNGPDWGLARHALVERTCASAVDLASS